MTSRPRRQAYMRCWESPTASARSASANHATARDSGGPCPRPAAAAANCSSATAVRPRVKATRPVASCASGWSGEDSSDNPRTHRWASRSKAAVAGPASTPALTRTSSACARHQRRPCRSKSLRASVAHASAFCGFAGGQRTLRRGEQQFGPLGGAAVDLVQLADCGLGLIASRP